MIELKNVNYIYSPGTAFVKQALKDVNLRIKNGEFIGLIGHTGSGKSTLTQLLNGLIKPSSGNIFYNGVDICVDGYNLRELRGKVGLVFQYPEHQLFESSVIKDVEFGPKNFGLCKDEARERACEALKDVGLSEEFYELSPFELSGGQKRRVAIAGVLAMQPEVLILDEPNAALVSHSMDDAARYADRLIVMNHGKVKFNDSPSQVFLHYKELEKIHLAAPEITYVMNELNDKGIDVATDAITIEEAKTEILNWVKHGGLIK